MDLEDRLHEDAVAAMKQSANEHHEYMRILEPLSKLVHKLTSAVEGLSTKVDQLIVRDEQQESRLMAHTTELRAVFDQQLEQAVQIRSMAEKQALLAEKQASLAEKQAMAASMNADRAENARYDAGKWLIGTVMTFIVSLIVAIITAGPAWLHYIAP